MCHVSAYQWYDSWMKKKRVILIGGAPTTGKSTVAIALAKKLGLPWISTDQIRSVMKSVGDRQAYPDLFNSADYDAERFLTELSAEQIVKMEFEQGAETWLGVKALIRDVEYEWVDGCVIEDVGIVPHVVARDFKDHPDVTAVFLVDHDVERMRKTIFTRGLWANADQYGDHLKEKEVEWAQLYGQRLEAEAKKYDYPWIEVHKNADDLKRVIEAIG